MAKVKITGNDFYRVVNDHVRTEQSDGSSPPQSLIGEDGDPVAIVFESALRVIYTSMLTVGAPLTANGKRITAVTEGTYGVFGDTETGYQPFRMILNGDFEYGNLGTVSGTLNKITIKYDGETVMRVTQLGVDAGEAWAALQSGEGAIDPAVAVSVRKDEAAVLYGGNDRFIGGAGSDYFGPSAGKDKMFGNGGADAMRGGRGADTLKGGAGNDSLRGDEGRDVLRGGNGDDLIDGRFGNDLLRGDGGDDRLRGDSGSDTFEGGAGDDVLESSDTDFISGVGERAIEGEHLDVFLFGRGDGNDSLLGYDPDVDTIVIDTAARSDVSIEEDANGNAVLAFANVTVTFFGVEASDVAFELA